ncbi:MAG: hypothetical protein PUC29_04970 [Clostridia bacterium]|nr:hypothetical protein [Clostridia bacterium]
MEEDNTKIELFTKKAKIITVITCICAAGFIGLQFYIGYYVNTSISSMEITQGYRMKLWVKILAIINANLSLVLFFTGPAYQVIDDQRTERRKLSRRKTKNNKKKKKHQFGSVKLSNVFLLLLSILVAVCIIEIIPIKQDIDNSSFKTYDGVCTVLSDRVANTGKTFGSVKKVLLNELDIRVKGDTGLDRGEYYAHVVYSEKSKYIVVFSLTEEELQ